MDLPSHRLIKRNGKKWQDIGACHGTCPQLNSYINSSEIVEERFVCLVFCHPKGLDFFFCQKGLLTVEAA